MLRAFDAVGRVGGIRSAARLLEVDHTVVSRHIRALEAWAGARLVSRTTGGSITLTPEGARYHARISAALAEMNDAGSELRSRNRRRLVVWCVPGLAVQWLIARLPHFPSGNAIELHPTDRSPDFERFEADADIRYVFGNTDYRKLVAVNGVRYAEIARPPIVAVASPACSDLLDNVRQAADLLNAPLLHEESDAQWRSWFSAHGVSSTPDSLQGPRLWHAHVALEAARCGQGVALANSFLIQNDLTSGRLVQVAPWLDSLEVALGTYVFAARSDRWQSADIVRFRRWLKVAATAEGSTRSATALTQR